MTITLTQIDIIATAIFIFFTTAITTNVHVRRRTIYVTK